VVIALISSGVSGLKKLVVLYDEQAVCMVGIQTVRTALK
jgi:hypothetical protein